MFKDASFLSNAVTTIETATSALTSNFQLVIAEDGSNSSEIIVPLKTKFNNVTHIQHDERLGRGRALREAWAEIHGDLYLYVDVDMASDLERYDAYKNLIKLQQQYDLVTGSRYLPKSVTKRPLTRRLASVVYNWLVRTVFGTRVYDHQCGFKSFSKRLVQTLSEKAKSDSWFWDTEVIVIAKKMGYTIKEIPIHWTEKKGKKTPLRRLAKDVWLHGVGFLVLAGRVYIRRDFVRSDQV
jgi:hypothetical protein